MLTPSQSSFVTETLRVSLAAAAADVDATQLDALARAAAALTPAESREPHAAWPAVGSTVQHDLVVGTEPGENAIFELTEEKCGDLPDTLLEPINLYETREAGQGDLFALDTPLVALAGTSFSTEPYNFDGFLSEALRQPVLNAAVSAGGLYTALQDLLLNREPGGNPRVIVWEYRLGDAALANGGGRAAFPAFASLNRIQLDPTDVAGARTLAEAAVKGRVVRGEDRAMQRAAAQLLPLLRAGNGKAAAALAKRLMPFGGLAK